MDNIQELIALYAEKKDQNLYQTIIGLIQTNQKIWIAYSPITKNHYMEYIQGRPTAFIFSEKDFCNDFKDHLLQQNIKTETMECSLETRTAVFSDFFRSGIETVLVDNGKNFLMTPLFDIIDKPDFSSLPSEPVVNPSLVASADCFFQAFSSKKVNRDMELNMMRNLYGGKYLLPVIIDANTSTDKLTDSVIKTVMTGSETFITIPELKGDKGQILIPLFTDWLEFSKFDIEKQCVGNVVTFKDIEYFCQQGEKVAVNPFGFNMVIDKNSLNVIKSVSADLPKEKEEPITLFNLDSVPQDMIRMLERLLEQTEGVKSAYLKGMVRGEKTGYLLIVDFEGSNSEVFGKIAEQISAYTRGVPIDFVKLDSEFGQKAAENTYPFYQRFLMS